jgi:hypothetical protein
MDLAKIAVSEKYFRGSNSGEAAHSVQKTPTNFLGQDGEPEQTPKP